MDGNLVGARAMVAFGFGENGGVVRDSLVGNHHNFLSDLKHGVFLPSRTLEEGFSILS
jgi:hypothetical protein